MTRPPRFVRHVLAVGVLAIASPLGAQEMAPAVPGPVTIQFYNYNLASAGLGREGTQEMLDSFMEASPDITVEGVPVVWSEMAARIQTDTVAGQSPDIAQVVFNDLSFIVENFGVEPLEEIVPAAELSEHFAGFFRNGLDLGRIGDGTFGLAYVFSTPLLFYNADLFRAAGLDPDSPPETWSELRDAAIAISEATDQPGFHVATRVFPLQGVVMSNGGALLSEDRTTLEFGKPLAVDAIAMLRSIVDAGAMENLGSDAIEAFSGGQLGMFLNTSAYMGAFIRGSEGKFELRAAPMPAFGDRTPAPMNSGSALVILTDDPVKRRAAWELMKHLTSDYGYTIITSKIGYVPLRPNAIESEEYLAPYIRQNPMVQPNIAQLENLTPWVSFPGPNYRQIETTIHNAWEQAIFGGADVAQTLSEAQARAQDLMPR